jgi:hypothetical protein
MMKELLGRNRQGVNMVYQYHEQVEGEIGLPGRGASDVDQGNDQVVAEGVTGISTFREFLRLCL